jgi:hypothetical protein
VALVHRADEVEAGIPAVGTLVAVEIRAAGIRVEAAGLVEVVARNPATALVAVRATEHHLDVLLPRQKEPELF